MRRRRVVIGVSVAVAVLAVAFGVYLSVLYVQLGKAFSQQEEFVPTRIYSDVTRIAPPQPRNRIEERLKALAYTFTSQGEELSFTLHTVEFPAYLLPDNHPVAGAGGQTVVLRFDGDERTGSLQSIQLGDQEVADLYLEPELVATLSRGGGEKDAKVREWVKFEDVPALVWKAIIAIEDQHFLEHKGLDPRGIARAIWVNLKTRSLAQGGSTITQQLVKNLMVRRTKNIFRKFNELFLALLLEVKYSKEEILERYLNEVYLGQIGSLEIHGVAEGAKYFFDKRLDDLNLAEIALMAGLIRGPGYYSPYRYKDRAMERQQLVLRKMVETGQIAEADLQEATRQPVRLAPPMTVANKAPFFTDFVKAELIRQLKDRIAEQEVAQAGFRVYTTLDTQMNAIAQRAVATGVAELERRHKLPPTERLEGALAAVDHTTGYIRALVGGRSYAQSTFNRILNMRRQVGSTFKPIVYLTAFQSGKDFNGVPYGPGHPAEDAPWKLTFDGGRQVWVPRNYDPDHRGWISFREALAHSVNTVAAKLGFEIGIDNIIRAARALGVQAELPRVPSLSLGIAELSPVELLRVYATFANHGIQDELTVIRAITQDDGRDYARFVYHPKEVFDPAAVDLLTDMLQTVLTDGSGRGAAKLGFTRPAAGKTGTTSHHRDSWFAGYTPQLTAVVWVGLDAMALPPEGADAKKKKPAKLLLTGGSSALPIWAGFMNDALEGEPPITFPLSPHLSQVLIDRHSGNRATSDCPNEQVLVEKAIKDREPEQESCSPTWPMSIRETSAP